MMRRVVGIVKGLISCRILSGLVEYLLALAWAKPWDVTAAPRQISSVAA